MKPNCESIKEWLSSFTLVQSCDEIADGHLRLMTPFLYPDGSNIDLFFKFDFNLFEGHLITDLGQTSGYLSDLDINFQTHPRRDRLLRGICRTLDVVNLDGELVTRLPKSSFDSDEFRSEFSAAVLRMAQACIRTADLSFTKQFKVASNFRNELRTFLTSTNVRLEENKKMEGRYGKLVRVDFRTAIRGGKNLILAISPQTPEGAHGASIEVFSKWYDLDRQKDEYQFITVVDSAAAHLKDNDLKRLEENSRVISFPQESGNLSSIVAA